MRPEGDGADGLGGGLYNGVASTHPSNLNAPTVLTVEGRSSPTTGPREAPPGAGTGRRRSGWRPGTAAPPSSATRRSATTALLGGDGADGSGGGDGFGGGAYSAAAGSLRFEGCASPRTTPTAATRVRGGSEGEGIGGGVYNLGLFDFDAAHGSSRTAPRPATTTCSVSEGRKKRPVGSLPPSKPPTGPAPPRRPVCAPGRCASHCTAGRTLREELYDPTNPPRHRGPGRPLPAELQPGRELRRQPEPAGRRDGRFQQRRRSWTSQSQANLAAR